MFRERRWGWIGIDIGTRAVKIAQVERPGGRWRIAHAVILHDTQRRPLEELALSDEWLVRMLRQRLGRRGGFRGQRAACVLSLSGTDLRTVEIPDGTEGERRAMIAQELETSLDAGGDGHSFDYWDTPARSSPRREAAAKSVHVLSVAAELADRVAVALHRCGLACEILDGLPTALARATALTDRPAGEPQAVLDWGDTTATFIVSDGTVPLFTRELRGCALQPLMGTLARGLNLSLDDIEQFLVTYGLPDPAAVATSKAELQRLAADLCAEPLREMVDQLQRTLGYLRQQRSGCVPQQIRLVGGGATIANIAPYLSARTNVPVEVWRLGGGSGETWTGGLPEPLLASAASLSALAWEP